MACSRNPEVGDPPASQELSGAVANPRPKVLSKNPQKRVHPSESRRRTRSVCLQHFCLAVADFLAIGRGLVFECNLFYSS